MPVKYRAVVHDEEHTMEQQVSLLATSAARAWRLWAGKDGKPSSLQGVSPEFDAAMQELFRQCYQTDVFMSGRANG